MTSRTNLADAHDRNFVAALSLLADSAPAGSTRRFGRVPVAVIGVPSPFFNAAWVLDPPDPADLQAALDHLRARSLPFTVHLRSDLSGTARMGIDHGLSDEGLLPCFGMERRPTPPPRPDLEIERVGARNWGRFADATAAGFDMPRAMVDELLVPATLDDDRLRAFIGIADGHAVATAVSFRTDTTLGIYNVATVAQARGRGIGTAMTWHLLADADPDWEVAILQASEMGRPIYERMGFRLVREFIELVGRPA